MIRICVKMINWYGFIVVHTEPMYLICVFYQVIVLTTVSAYDIGNVVRVAPVGTFKFLFSLQDNNLLDEQFQLLDFKIKTTKGNAIRVLCNKFLLNTEPGYEMLRLTLVTKENIELESFEVSQCNINDIYNILLVNELSNKPRRKEYVIWFKTKNQTCLLRRYTVGIDQDEDYPIIIVDRSDPEEYKISEDPWSSEPCPVSGSDRLITGWIQNGAIHEFTLPGKHDTIIRLDAVECSNCYIKCKEDKPNSKFGKKNSKFFVDLMVENVPVDRLKTTSCDKVALKRSIQIDKVNKNEGKVDGIVMNFLKPDGHCQRRKYQFKLETSSETLFMAVVHLTREKEQNNDDCTHMRYEGYKEYLVRTAADTLVGQVVTHLLSTFRRKS